MLCTSGFMDDVTFGSNGRDAKRWRLHPAAMAMNDVAMLERRLMSMNACHRRRRLSVFTKDVSFYLLVYFRSHIVRGNERDRIKT